MDVFDDFYAYGDDSTHDMMADYDYYINTGELCDCFEEEEKLKNLKDQILNLNLNSWYLKHLLNS